MDDLDALARASGEFARLLDDVRAEQWNDATPCGDWDVAALVDHVNVGNRMTELLVHGADARTSIGPAAQSPAGQSPAATFAITSAAQLAALSEPDALTRTVHHPAMDMAGEALLMFRTADLVLHGWDLASSIGIDPTIDADLVDALWAKIEPIAPLLTASGMFGTPSRDLAETASTQDKLLNAVGR